MADFDNVDEFLDQVALRATEVDSDGGDRVSIMTMHASKGLEFEAVFLPGWEDGLFPNQRSLDRIGNVGLFEERRLGYVAITRAAKRVFISHASTRELWAMLQSPQPSRFLAELPPRSVKTTGP